MHRKTHVVTTSVLGGLLLTIPAFAQTTTTTTQTQTTQGSRSHFNPSASTDINAQPSGAGVHANANINDEHAARGSQATSSAGCPPGCVAARHYTPAQVAAMRRSRDERRDQLAREQAERDQQLQDCRTRAERAESEAQQLRAQNQQSEQDRLAREQAEREERDRKARESAMVQPYVPTYTTTTVRRARGGGPNYDMRSAHLLLGLEGGVGGWTGAANAQYFVGPTWGARAGVNVMNWLGIEARYFGMWNQARVPVTGTVGGTALNSGTVTNELTGVLRLTIPTPYIRPYGFAGVGGAWNTTSFINGATAQQGTTLRDNRSGVVPVGGGLDVPIGTRWGLGFEGAYHWYMNQNFTTDPTTNTGGQWHTSMNIHVNI